MKLKKLAAMLVLGNLSATYPAVLAADADKNLSQAANSSNNASRNTQTRSLAGRSASRSGPSKSDHRQIAAILPSAPQARIQPYLASAAPVKEQTGEGQVKSAPTDLLKATGEGWKKLSAQLPSDVDDACDYCAVTATKLTKAASLKAIELSKWADAYTTKPADRTGSAAFTSYRLLPAKEALKPVEFNNRLWFLPDGRLKTLVQR